MVEPPPDRSSRRGPPRRSHPCSPSRSWPRLPPAAGRGRPGHRRAAGATSSASPCLARYPVACYELVVCGADIEPIRARLVRRVRDAAASTWPCSATACPGGRCASWRSTSTPPSSRTRSSTCWPPRPAAATRCAAVTERAMAGELDFEDGPAGQRVALLAGLHGDVLDQARAPAAADARAPGPSCARCKRLGYRIAIVSGGFTEFTDRARGRAGRRPRLRQPARGGRRAPHGAAGRARSSTGRRKAELLARGGRRGGGRTGPDRGRRRRRQRPRHAGGGRPRHRLQRQAAGAGRRRHRPVASPTSTPCCSCSASAGRRWRRPTPT